MVPDLGSATSVLCQQAAAVGLSQEALLRLLVSAAAVRGGAPALPPLPEAVAAAEERAAIAQAAAAAGEEGAADSSTEWIGDGSIWGTFAAIGDESWDAQGVKELLDQPIEIASWGPLEEEGAEAAEAAAAASEEAAAAEAAAAAELDNPFQFVDATADPLLDPALAAQQQAAWEEEQEAEGLGLPYGYDEIREDAVLVEAVSGAAYGVVSGCAGWRGPAGCADGWEGRARSLVVAAWIRDSIKCGEVLTVIPCRALPSPYLPCIRPRMCMWRTPPTCRTAAWAAATWSTCTPPSSASGCCWAATARSARSRCRRACTPTSGVGLGMAGAAGGVGGVPRVGRLGVAAGL